MLKFLVDENVGQSVIDYLKKKKYDILIAKEKLLRREDYFLLQLAYNEQRIIITNDKDFGELVFHEKLPAYCIILFRFKLENPILKIRALDKILSLNQNKLINHFIIVNESSFRIRVLS